MKYIKPFHLIVLFLLFCIGFNLVCSCSPFREAFGAGVSWKSGRGLPDMGSPLNWSMDQGIPDNWKQIRGNPPLNHATISGTPVPLPNGELFLFANNKSSLECCGSASYSSSDGCICASKAQMDYINQRGGNRTMDDGY